MKVWQLAVAALVMAGLTTTAMADDKFDLKKQLVGKWEATKVAPESLPEGATVEFSADGKVKVVAGDITAEGTYTVDGSSFKCKLNINGEEKTHSVKVKKVTDKEMDVESDGKDLSFKKVK